MIGGTSRLYRSASLLPTSSRPMAVFNSICSVDLVLNSRWHKRKMPDEAAALYSIIPETSHPSPPLKHRHRRVFPPANALRLCLNVWKLQLTFLMPIWRRRFAEKIVHRRTFPTSYSSLQSLAGKTTCNRRFEFQENSSHIRPYSSQHHKHQFPL